MGSTYNTVIVAAVAVYIVLTLPVIQQAAVVVLGLFFASIIGNPSMRDFGFRILGSLNRGVFNALKKRQSNNLRASVIMMCAAIDQYPAYVRYILNRKRRLFFMLDQSQQKSASRTYEALNEIESYADANFAVLKQFKEYGMDKFDITQRDIWGHKPNTYGSVELIEHLVRDWSNSNNQGTSRQTLFQPFWPYLKDKKRVLVPGSGVGRFPFDIANQLGPDAIVDAPELSPFMYVGSMFATSRPSKKSLKVFPYLLEFSYWKKRSDQLKSSILELPSVEAAPNNANFYFGDFLTFDRGYTYDAIATLFFIDTAQNVFKYIDRIAEMLSSGGIWINYGPLKWGTAAFVEFSVDELLSYLRKSGWIIEETWTGENRYNGSDNSMLNTKYELIGWAARRV